MILALPLMPQTRRIIDAAALAAMRADAMLVNVSRGDLIDEPALIAALDAGHLRGVGLDVAATEPLPAHSPLRRFERVIISPHTAIVDDGLALAGLTALCRENLERFISGQALLNEVALAR